MQSFGAVTNEGVQQVEVAEQTNHNAVDQLAKRVATLEAGQNSAGQRSNGEIRSQLQAESAQVQAQNAAVKDQASKIQAILHRVEALEKNQKKSDTGATGNTGGSTSKQDELDNIIIRRLDKLDKKVKERDSASSQTEHEMKDLKLELKNVREELSAMKSVNAGLHTELQNLKASSNLKQPPPPPQTKTTQNPPPAPPAPPSQSETQDSDEDESQEADDASFLQFGHRHREVSMRTEFHRKIRHGKHGRV